MQGGSASDGIYIVSDKLSQFLSLHDSSLNDTEVLGLSS